MKRSSSLNYALGRVKALGNKLIPPDRWEQMLSAPDQETLIKNISAQSASAVKIETVRTADDLERISAAWDQELLAVFRELPLSEDFLGWLNLGEEFFNLRYLLRIKMEGWAEIPAWVKFSPLALTPVHVLADFVWHGTSWQLERTWPLALIKKLAGIVKAPRQGDVWSNSLLDLDKVYLTWRQEEAARLGGADLAGLAALEIDAFNLENLGRLWIGQEKTEGLAEFFLAGGTISPEALAGLYQERPEVLANFLHATAWGHDLDAAWAEFDQTKSLTGLTKAMADFFTGYLGSGRALGPGFLPLLRYFRAKRQEIINLRLLLEGFYYGLPVEAIRPLLRMTNA